MNPINPWVDAAEVRRLADLLLAPSPQPDAVHRDAGFDNDFIGYAAPGSSGTAAPFRSDAPPAGNSGLPACLEAQIPSAPVPESEIRVPNSEIPFPFPGKVISAAESPAPPPAPTPFQPIVQNRNSARGPFLDRITRFRDWFIAEFAATGIFILDREGFVIFDESGNDKLHSLARNLALASRNPGAPPANVRLKIGTRATLEVIPVDTAYGYLVLAAIVPDTLQPPAIAAIMDALARAATPPSAAP